MKIKKSNTKLFYNKAILFCFIIISTYSVAKAQSQPWISAEVKINSIFYPLEAPILTFNYGASILLSENFGRSRISFGGSFSTFDFTYDYPTESDNLISRDYSTLYLNFPLLYAYMFPLSHKLDMSVLGGVSFSVPQKSVAVSYYNNRDPEEVDLIKQNISSNRLNIKTGLSIYYHLNRRLNVVGNFFTELNVTGTDESHRDINAPISSALGFGIGIEYNWKPLIQK